MSPSRADRSKPRAISPLAAALWATLLSMLQQVCLGTTEALRPGALTDVVSVTACEVLATSIAIFAIVAVYAGDLSLRAALGIRPASVAALTLGALSGAGLMPLCSTIDDWIVRRWPYDDPEAVETMAKLVRYPSRAVLVLSMFVVVPVARELFFRGVLFGRLVQAVRPQIAVLVTALFYACSWLDWRAIPSALVLGLALALLRASSGSVLVAIAAHLAFWAVEGVAIVRGRDPSADVVYGPGWVVGGAVAAGAALIVTAVAARRTVAGA